MLQTRLFLIYSNMSWIQETKEPDVQALYTIKFTTNNPLPYQTSMIVKMP